MNDGDIHEVMEIIKSEFTEFEDTAVNKIAKTERSPFKILISTLISSRTKDEVTHAASKRLFSKASTPEEMLELNREEIQELIYPAGFYKNKSKYIIETSKILIEEYNGKVPESIDELTQLMGVGRKTANLVVTLAFNKPGICVDTHVHRIPNRWGYIDTDKPRNTEKVLREKLPQQYWIPINKLLVSYGQNICTPVSPYCSKCKLKDKYCQQKDVDKTR